MIEQQIDIDVNGSAMSTFVCHPERGGPHPVLLFFMDAPGIREELRDMARRFATVGYYVMLPNLYHRLGVFELGSFVGPEGMANRERAMSLMMKISVADVDADTNALLAFADADAAASKGSAGAIGYCMSGRYAIRAAAKHPNRVVAAASIYGTRLVVSDTDSPHELIQQSDAEFYIGCAEIDHYVSAADVAVLRDTVASGRVNGEVELYEGVEHGFAFPGRPAYHKASAERHWERVLALFGRAL